jgi:hypothetical protein
MTSEKVVGKITVSNANASIDGSSARPAISTESGLIVCMPVSNYSTLELTALTIQNTPNTAPLMIANATVNAYDVAGIQRAHTATEHVKVAQPATSKRPNLSLRRPTMGRPTAVPRLSSAVTEDACELDNPIDRAKSDIE